LEGKPRPGKTERTREIAERLKKHRPPVDRDEKRSPKKPAEQKAEKPERDAAWPVIKRDEEAKLDWPSFKPMGGSLFEEESEGAFDKPGEAAEFFNKKRLPKGEKEFPLEEYFRAHEQMRQMPQFSTSLQRFLTKEEATAFRSNRLNKEAAAPQLEAAGWAPLGPGNIGGRTRAILINPQDANIMYAAGVSGGVWKSTNAGQSWTPITDMLANITVSTMAFEPGNPNVIYVGSGEGVLGTESDTLGDFRGAGIFKTTDGGATWARLEQTKSDSFYYINDIVVSSVDKNRVYAATRNGVWRSLDAGANWSQVFDATNNSTKFQRGCLDLAIRANQQNDVLFASCGNFEQGAVFRNPTADASGAWTAVLSESGMGRTALAISPSNPDVIYALASSIERNDFTYSLFAVYRSTGGGVEGSWTPQVRNTSANKINRAILSIPTLAVSSDCGYDFDDGYVGQGWYDLAIAVDPLTDRLLTLSAVSPPSTTVEKFARPRTGQVSWVAFDPTNKDIVYATISAFNSAGNVGHVFRSVDGGMTWTNIDGTGTASIPDIPVHCIVVDPSSTARLYVGTDLGVFVSNDGGDRRRECAGTLRGLNAGPHRPGSGKPATGSRPCWTRCGGCGLDGGRQDGQHHYREH